MPRSAAAEEGIALLKRGSKVHKHNRSGKSALTVFTLSADERTISWEGHGIGTKLLNNKKRSVDLHEVLEVLVGHESALFQQTAEDRLSEAHLSISLILLPSLPDVPSPAPTRSSMVMGANALGAAERASLDLGFEDDETFGLWLAALRAARARPAASATYSHTSQRRDQRAASLHS